MAQCLARPSSTSNLSKQLEAKAKVEVSRPLAPEPLLDSTAIVSSPPQDTATEPVDDSRESTGKGVQALGGGRQSAGFPLLTANFYAPDCVDPFDSTAFPRGQGVEPILQFYISWASNSSITQYTPRPQADLRMGSSLHDAAEADLFRPGITAVVHDEGQWIF